MALNEVVDELNDIVVRGAAEADPLAYFAALYRQVTLSVQAALLAGVFADPARMEHLVAGFANRYLVALQTYRRGEEPSKSWAVAFDAARSSDVTVLQHLLLGINAHINLDLGIAVAQVYAGDRLAAARGDFDRINDILASLMDRVEGVVEAFSPLLGILDKLCGPADEAIVNFSVRHARADAWKHAVLLAAQTAEQQALTIDLMDRKAAFLARLVASPGGLLGKGLELVRARESHEVARIAAALNRMVAGAP